MDQKKKYIVVSGLVLMEMMDCFSSMNEFDQFISDLMGCMEEMKFIEATSKRDCDNPNAGAVAAMRMMFLMAYFCRDNIEIIQQLVGKIRFELMDNREKDEKMKELGDTDRELMDRLIREISETPREEE